MPNVQQETYRLLLLPACGQGPDRCVDGPPEDLKLLQGCCSLDFVVGLLTRHLCDWSEQLVYWLVGVLGSIFAFLHCHLICCPVEFLLLLSLERPLIHFPRLSVFLCCSLSPILHFTLVLCLLIGSVIASIVQTRNVETLCLVYI